MLNESFKETIYIADRRYTTLNKKNELFICWSFDHITIVFTLNHATLFGKSFFFQEWKGQMAFLED
jgi:hypothetical protein